MDKLRHSQTTEYYLALKNERSSLAKAWRNSAYHCVERSQSDFSNNKTVWERKNYEHSARSSVARCCGGKGMTRLSRENCWSHKSTPYETTITHTFVQTHSLVATPTVWKLWTSGDLVVLMRVHRLLQSYCSGRRCWSFRRTCMCRQGIQWGNSASSSQFIVTLELIFRGQCCGAAGLSNHFRSLVQVQLLFPIQLLENTWTLVEDDPSA